MQNQMNFEKVAIGSLSFDPTNVRKHDKRILNQSRLVLGSSANKSP